MLVKETLAAWSAACKDRDILWYLYRDTLLCAHGYEEFPETLKYAQVAVYAKDLQQIVESVFAELAQKWNGLEWAFDSKTKVFCLTYEGEVILSIDVLYLLDSSDQFEKHVQNISEAHSTISAKKFILKVFGLVLGERFRRPLAGLMKREQRKLFNILVELTANAPSCGKYYCEYVSGKKGTLFDSQWLAGTEMMVCGEQEYPVFGGWREYLELQYGDFETGLVDDIGCGLSVEEKMELKEHQCRCKEALEFIQTLSEEFHLRYYLLAGSVLGAVRHEGFIPWDDDIDIGIRIEEIEDFEKKVKEYLPLRLPEGFTLEQSRANHPYPRMFSKICYDGRCCMDLWPLVPTYEDGWRAKWTWYFAKLITKVHYEKIGHDVNKYRKLAKVTGMFLNDKMVMWLARRNERKYTKRITPAYINLYSIYKRNKETIKRSWLDQEATAMFEGIEVPVVGDTEAYLTHLYGDYMAKPAPWKRASRHVARFYTAENLHAGVNNRKCNN